MKVAFLHYHLKTGGVTTVLHRQAQCIHPDHEVLVLSGSPPTPGFPFPTSVIEAIGYDHPDRIPVSPERVAQQVDKAVRSHFSGICDLLHVHNPFLAKNQHLLQVLNNLQKLGYRLLLQIHDFAEDGRPHLYYPDPYPTDCHYVVINSRDRHALLDAGAAPRGVHCLPNMVVWPDTQESAGSTTKTVLYPIRAIRRKNIGEAILMSLFFKAGEKLAITLPPNSPADFPSYEGWKRLVGQRNLNVEFEAGLNADFPDLVRSSNILITTSIMEGFGFAFLEPWLANKLLGGRKLPEICIDFEQNGLRLPHLYTALNVPLQWIDKDRFRAEWTACVQNVSGRFATTVRRTELESAYVRITAGEIIDFGLLSEFYQKQVLTRILDDRSCRSQLIAMNPWLDDPANPAATGDLIAANRQIVSQHYNSRNYRESLMNIYQRVVSEPVRQQIDKQKLLSTFLKLESFSLLKWAPYTE